MKSDVDSDELLKHQKCFKNLHNFKAQSLLKIVKFDASESTTFSMVCKDGTRVDNMVCMVDIHVC